jgi:hypothetical protein
MADMIREPATGASEKVRPRFRWLPSPVSCWPARRHRPGTLIETLMRPLAAPDLSAVLLAATVA